jgi:hypothetical protein
MYTIFKYIKLASENMQEGFIIYGIISSRPSSQQSKISRVFEFSLPAQRRKMYS